MNKSFVLPVSALSVLAFLVAGCGTANDENDCGAGCRDVLADAVGDAKTDAGRDVTDAGRDASDIGAGDASSDVVIVPPRQDCLPCNVDGDCGVGYQCQQLEYQSYCLHNCADDGDCSSGYGCNSSVFPGVCRPVWYSCPTCAREFPCDDGMCCDLHTGACKECKQECQVCLYDYDCASGLRCHRADEVSPGNCVPECREGECPDPVKQTCTNNGHGVMMCVPDEGYCPGCTEPRPFQLPDGSCVACRDSEDCPGDSCCDPLSHGCEAVSWESWCRFCQKCVCSECCTDEDCIGQQSTGRCLVDGTCEAAPPCGGLCTPDFPHCVVIDGVEQCVQCRVDADCLLLWPSGGCTCSGNPSYYCMDRHGGVCGGDGCTAVCSEDSDCPPSLNGDDLSCHAFEDYSLCYDPAGTCDNQSSCCAPGQKCFDMTLLIGSLQGLEIETSGSGICDCSLDNPCISTKPCTDLAILCTDEALVAQLGLTFAQTCPNGQLSPTMPPMICAEVADLIAAVPLKSVYGLH